MRHSESNKSEDWNLLNCSPVAPKFTQLRVDFPLTGVIYSCAGVSSTSQAVSAQRRPSKALAVVEVNKKQQDIGSLCYLS